MSLNCNMSNILKTNKTLQRQQNKTRYNKHLRIHEYL